MGTTNRVACEVKDLALAAKGKTRIEWANQWMPVLQLIRKQFVKERPLQGVRISACLHVTTETANLAITLRDGGADVVVCASNPLSTQDDVAASLVQDCHIPVFAIKGEDKNTYYSHIVSALEHRPQVTMDDGADLVTMILTKRQDLIPHLIGGTEETTTGVVRLRSMARSEEHTSELQSPCNLVCRLLLEKKNKIRFHRTTSYDHNQAILTWRRHHDEKHYRHQDART